MLQHRVIVSKANQALVIPRIGQTVNLFPKAHRLAHLDQDWLVVPHDIRSHVMLKRLGIESPNPMLLHYDWVGGAPFAVQRATCAMLTSNQRAYVLNSMGTGKTKSALWAWDYLHGNGLAGKLLVVAPKSTLRFTWAREIFATLPHRKVEILIGEKKRRLEALNRDADIYVINHDGVKVIEEQLAARKDIDAIVLDELAVYRNNSDRSKRMRKFAKNFGWIWGMTGCPMPQEPTDVWAQCMIVTPDTVPKYWTHARDMLMTKINQFKYVPKPDAVDTAFRFMQPSVRFSLDDVVELPEVVSRTLDVPLSTEQQRVYKALADKFRVDVHNKSITAVNAAAAMNKLLQVACGWVYTGATGSVSLDAKPRVEVLLDLIEANERKLIVYVPFRHAIDGLSQILTQEGIEAAVVHGEVSNRDEIFNAFQNTTKYKVMLAHPGTVAHGLTLTAADAIIWYSPMASLETYEQANARITRVGQKHRKQVIHLQSTPVEKRIYNLLRGKKRVQDALLEMFEDASEELIT